MKRLQIRRDTAENWQRVNPVLLLGEPAYTVENGHVVSMKVGNGVSAWSQLPSTKALTDDEWTALVARVATCLKEEVAKQLYLSKQGGTVSGDLNVTGTITKDGDNIDIYDMGSYDGGREGFAEELSRLANALTDDNLAALIAAGAITMDMLSEDVVAAIGQGGGGGALPTLTGNSIVITDASGNIAASGVAPTYLNKLQYLKDVSYDIDTAFYGVDINMANRYTKDQTYNKEEVDEMIARNVLNVSSVMSASAHISKVDDFCETDKLEWGTVSTPSASSDDDVMLLSMGDPVRTAEDKRRGMQMRVNPYTGDVDVRTKFDNRWGAWGDMLGCGFGEFRMWLDYYTANAASVLKTYDSSSYAPTLFPADLSTEGLMVLWNDAGEVTADGLYTRAYIAVVKSELESAINKLSSNPSAARNSVRWWVVWPGSSIYNERYTTDNGATDYRARYNRFFVSEKDGMLYRYNKVSKELKCLDV